MQRKPTLKAYKYRIYPIVTITNDFGSCEVEHQKYFPKAEERLRRLQRFLSLKQKGSKNSEKARLRLVRQHAYITNVLNELLHKLSKAIIDEHRVVGVEDINVKGLLKTRFAKSISDIGWAQFLTYRKYKTEWYGSTLIQVDRFLSPSINLCYAWLGCHEGMQALVDDRSPNGLPKKSSCDATESSTVQC